MAEHGKMLENKILFKVLKTWANECSNGDLGLTLTFYGKAKFAFWSFIWVEFIDPIEDFGANVNGHS